jgi:hypothetical protein
MELRLLRGSYFQPPPVMVLEEEDATTERLPLAVWETVAAVLTCKKQRFGSKRPTRGL